MNGHERALFNAFCAPGAPEVFHSVQHRHDIWKQDPYDVESIHEEARATFGRLLSRATSPAGVDSGRILLLKGESGAGKTHLMRAFRNEVHRNGSGYFGYMQLTTATEHYARYILSNFVDSLDHPYLQGSEARSGLLRLSDALAEAPKTMRRHFNDIPDKTALEVLRERSLSAKGIIEAVHILAEHIVGESEFHDIDIDLIRALLYLQRRDPLLKGLVVKYLRCEALAPRDQERLGGLVTRNRAEDAGYLLEQLGRIMAVASNAAMVVCVDQLEDVINLQDAGSRFRLSISALRAIIDDVPNSVVVIACLADYYDALRQHLDHASLDRVERNPEPIELTGKRSQEEVRLMAAKRLHYLYDVMDLEPDAAHALYPFPNQGLESLTGLRTRDVLDWCRSFQDQCIAKGQVPDDTALVPPGERPVPDEGNPLLALEQAWNDYTSTGRIDTPAEPEPMLALLERTLPACAEELQTPPAFSITREHEYLALSAGSAEFLLSICDTGAQGGGLQRELERFEDAARTRRMLILRNTEFPSNPATQIAKYLGTLLAGGAARFVMAPSEWRAMAAMEAFRAEHGRDPHFAEWRRGERPLTRQPSLQGLLELLGDGGAGPAGPPPLPEPTPEFETPPPESEYVMPPATTPAPIDNPGALAETAVSEAATSPSSTPQDDIFLGETPGLAPKPVRIAIEEFKRHTAFLGGSGSGKTTLALHCIEQLLLRGIPAILVDRKGDLGGYLDQARMADGKPAALRGCIDPVLYTPNHAGGRPLAIGLLPEEAGQLPSIERETLASHCADSLGGMMQFGAGMKDQTHRAIIKTALSVLLELTGGKGVTVESLADFIASQDGVLVNAVGGLDGKYYAKVSEQLQVLWLNKKSLFESGGERLDAEALLGLGRHAVPGRTRLSVISTKFFSDSLDAEFWITQLLLELGRWTSRNPAETLQAVVLFDEADLYLPAGRKPATKGPMEDLLKRARSAGLGVMLATQSPGDLDYKCRDNIRNWFIGRIKEDTALKKMKPMLSDLRVDLTKKLPQQGPGEFHFARDGQIDPLCAVRNLLPAEQLAEDQILALAAGPAT